MAQIQKIDKMPDEILECARARGKERTAEIKAVANMQVGDVLRMDFKGDEKAQINTRKCVESWRRRNRKNGLDYIICQRKGVLYVERVK